MRAAELERPQYQAQVEGHPVEKTYVTEVLRDKTEQKVRRNVVNSL